MNDMEPKKTVLHVGCGHYDPNALHPVFEREKWREIRLDINPKANPDIINSITEMNDVQNESVDAVWSSHNLEHLYSHEVPAALGEFFRVIKKGGFLLIALPDLQKAAEEIIRGNEEKTLYVSPSGPITALDIIFGHRRIIEHGNLFMRHKTGFTKKLITEQLCRAGFEVRRVEQNSFELLTLAVKC
jgi:predicted SAM-dependent methyltransferase